MTINELRHDIIKDLFLIEKGEVLSAIRTYIDLIRQKGNDFEFTDEQMEEVEIALRQLDEGQGVTAEEFKSKRKAWLAEMAK